MRLLRDHVGSFKEDLQLETAAAKLVFKVSLPNGTTFTEAVFNAMKVGVNIVTRLRGQQPLLPKMFLRDAFNISAVKEGFFVWGQQELKGYIDLSRIGSVAISDGDYFTIDFDGFPANATTSIYTIDVPVLTNSIQLVEEISINGTSKDIDVSEKRDLYLPVKDVDGNGIDNISVDFPGRTVTYTEEELKVINDSANDLTCVIDEQLDGADGTTRLVKFGYDRLLWLNVAGALKVRITPLTRNPIVIYTVKTLEL